MQTTTMQTPCRQAFSAYNAASFLVVAVVWAAVTLSLSARVAAECGEWDWECDNGKCIDIGDLCNGQPDCADLSDETAYNCFHQTCPSYSFRCAYGACIPKAQRCDGRKDCADGSDESMRLCGQLDTLNRLIQGSCPEDLMECSPGLCIELSKLCDGSFDCANGLDESTEFCVFNRCPNYSFQCAYGACSLPSTKCNFISDCKDNSDEAHELCGHKRVMNITSTFVKSKENEIAGPRPSDDEDLNQNPNFCLLPRHSPHLLVESGGELLSRPIRKDSFVRYSCEPGYNLVGKDRGYCLGPHMDDSFPKCEKFCRRQEILSDFSLKAVQCSYGEESFQCEDSPRIRPGYQVSLRCANYFYPSQEKKRFCTEEGTWSTLTNDCVMHCGTTLNALARGGIDVAKSEIPWHIGIYAIFDGLAYRYTCGGTIVSPIMVISAAHCFYDAAAEEAHSQDLYQVVAGKFFRDYNKFEQDAQIRNLSKIFLHRDYKPLDLLQSDMALVTLSEALEFTKNIRPICLGFVDHFSSPAGRLSAWGLSENVREKSEVLQVISGEHLRRDDCYTVAPSPFAADKYCTKYVGQGVACRGDSGGGYFIRVKDQHYLIGVLSIASNVDTTDCSLRDTVLYFSNVTLFLPWIRDTIRQAEAQYRLEKSKLY